jgi:hypothetical protein
MIPRYPDSFFVNDVPLDSYSLVVTDLSGLFAPGTRRGEDDVIPGRRGQVGAELPYDAYAFSIPCAFTFETGDGTGVLDARIAALGSLAGLAGQCAGNNGLVTLTRKLVAFNDDGYVLHTAAGRYVGGSGAQFLNPYNWTTELQFINLDGAWFDGDNWLVP